MVTSPSTLVSVIIATYKRANMVERAIDSVLNQTYKNIEIIVVDDNDPNTLDRQETELVMEKYSKKTNVIYIKHPKNINGAAARNTSIENSNGSFICFLDDDDWFLPSKIEKQINYLSSNNEYQAVYCGWRRNGKEFTPNSKGDLSFNLLSGTSLIYTNTIMMSRNAVIKCGGWDKRFRRNQEAAFLLRFFKQGFKIGVVSEVLVQFDTSDRSNASNPQKNEEDFDFYLSMHTDQINDCNRKHKNARDIIYSYRYRGVFLNYIKCRNYIGALKLYLKATKQIPYRFNKDLIIYAKQKIVN